MLDIDSSKFKVDIINLKDFPRTTLNNIVHGKNGIIEFYNVPDDVYTVSISETTGYKQYAKVKYWSIHKNRKIEIVTLENGKQIITDDDPRAVLGIIESNIKNDIFKFERFTPTEALKKSVYVPILGTQEKEKLLDYKEIDLDKINKEINSLDSALQVIYDLSDVGLIACLTFNKKWEIYFPENLVLENISFKDLKFSKVISVEKTGQYEDGYDLTIDDDNQNFLSHNNIILSNTINVHVPALPEAQRDLKEKLLPSKQIYSIRNVPKKDKSGEPIVQEEVINKLKQDLISGMYAVNKATPEKRWLFRTEAEALDAIKSGKVKLSDEVEILEN